MQQMRPELEILFWALAFFDLASGTLNILTGFLGAVSSLGPKEPCVRSYEARTEPAPYGPDV